jgi:peptide/nickel transport system permease protein
MSDGAPLHLARSGRVALGALAAIAVGVLVVPALSSRDPLLIQDVLARRLVAPLARDGAGAWHLLGTDRFGRDLFVRMMLAGRLSLLVGVALWPPGIYTILVVLILTGWMGVARLVRAEVRTVRERPFVPAAQALGATQLRVLARHVLPNAVGPALVATTLGVGNAILLESGLSFLGLGIQPPAPSWGNMIAGGRDLLVVAPWVSLAPGLALVVTVLATTTLGDAWRDRLAGERGATSPSERGA